MKNRRAKSEQGRGDEKGGETRSHGESQQTNQRNPHADGQGIRLRTAVSVKAHKWLKERSRHLGSKRDQTDLPKIQMERGAQNRIDSRNQRLHRIIQEVAET